MAACIFFAGALSFQPSTCLGSDDLGFKPIEDKAMEEKWGVRVLGIRLTAADYMLDFRYRVIDPEKAKPLLDKRVKPYLIDKESGRKLLVPRGKIGPIRQIGEKADVNRVYYMLFANAGKIVKRGSSVSVVIGDFKADNLTVE